MLKHALKYTANSWNTYKVGECAKLINGRAYSQHELLTTGDYQVIRIQNLNGGSNWYYSDLQLDEEKYCEQGDLLFAWSATFGPYVWNGPKAIFHYHIWNVKPNPDLLDKDFAYFLLLWITQEIKNGAHGIAMLHFTKEGMESFDISIPSLPQQRQIAARLKAQLAEVSKARQAAAAQLRDAHTLYAAILKETFFNEASETWPRIELGEVGDVVAGVTLGRKTNGKATRPIPYLRVANVKDGRLDLSDVSTIEATDAEIERLLLQPGDILLTEGGDPDKLGRGTFWSGELEECIHQNHIFRVRFPSESYLPEFIAAQIGSTYGKDYFFAHAKKTTGIATINQKVLKSFPVLSPTIEVQKGVMATLNSQLGETGKIILSATKQLNDINSLPQKILAQAFEM